VNFLLDTVVVSEWVKPRPDPGVVAWLDEADEDRTFISVATLAELRYGVERLPPGRRRTRLSVWLETELPLRFENRVLGVDQKTAEVWGRIIARGEAEGRPIGAMDALIAATAELHDLTLVTRNVKDFETVLHNVHNPWQAG
jgi:toxin FitB